MTHDLTKRGVQDAIQIDVHDILKFQDWAAEFKVSPVILREAIDAVGLKINNVREYLNKKGFIVAS